MKLSLLVAAVAAQRYNNNNNNNQQNNGYGAGYGDPHFMVKTPGQEQLCFDYSPNTDEPITLINDPVNMISITATTFGKSARTHMTEIDVMTPNGAQVKITSGEISSLTDAELVHNEKLSTYTQGDLSCKKSETPDKLHYHCQVENGPTFEIRSHHGHHSLAFAVHDTTGLSEKVFMIYMYKKIELIIRLEASSADLSRPTAMQSFQVMKTLHPLLLSKFKFDRKLVEQQDNLSEWNLSETGIFWDRLDIPTSYFLLRGKQYTAIKHHFHRAEECWTLKKAEVEALFN